MVVSENGPTGWQSNMRAKRPAFTFYDLGWRRHEDNRRANLPHFFDRDVSFRGAEKKERRSFIKLIDSMIVEA
jgi:hypothetical protein